MSVKVTLKDWKVPAKLAAISNDQGLGMFAAEEMGRGMVPFVPMESGVLSQFWGTEPFHVKYFAVYARKHFYGEGFNFSKEMHPLATARWDVAYIGAKVNDLTSAMQSYINRM